MKVSKLIESLSRLPQDLDVRVSANTIYAEPLPVSWDGAYMVQKTLECVPGDFGKLRYALLIIGGKPE